jgi:hypothetical protein
MVLTVTKITFVGLLNGGPAEVSGQLLRAAVQVEVIQRVIGFIPCPRFEHCLGMSDPGFEPQPGAVREPGPYCPFPAHRPSPRPSLSPDRASIGRRPPGSKLQLLGPVPLHDLRPTHLPGKPPRHRSLPPGSWRQALPPGYPIPRRRPPARHRTGHGGTCKLHSSSRFSCSALVRCNRSS